jgi:predicted negative regulator of RcsB-dependent stress response
MGALVWLFLKNNWIPIVIVLAVLVLAGWLYLTGRADGRAIGQAEQTQAIFNQLKERNITDEKVQGMSDPELCRAINGVWRDEGCH